MARGSYLGGGTLVRLDVYGADKPKPTKRAKSASAVADSEWLAANKKSNRKKQVKVAPTIEADYKTATKKRRKRAKKGSSK